MVLLLMVFPIDVWSIQCHTIRVDTLYWWLNAFSRAGSLSNGLFLPIGCEPIVGFILFTGDVFYY